MHMLLRKFLHRNSQTFIALIWLVSFLSACGPGVSDYSEKILGDYEYVSDSTTRNLIRNTETGSIVVDYCVEKYWSSTHDEIIVALRFPVNHRYIGERDQLSSEVTRSRRREIWIIHGDEVSSMAGEVTNQGLLELLESFAASSEFVAEVQDGLSSYYENREYHDGLCLYGI